MKKSTCLLFMLMLSQQLSTGAFAFSCGSGCESGYTCCGFTGRCIPPNGQCKMFKIKSHDPGELLLLKSGVHFKCEKGSWFSKDFRKYKGREYSVCQFQFNVESDISSSVPFKHKNEPGVLYIFPPLTAVACENGANPQAKKDKNSSEEIWSCPSLEKKKEDIHQKRHSKDK